LVGFGLRDRLPIEIGFIEIIAPVEQFQEMQALSSKYIPMIALMNSYNFKQLKVRYQQYEVFVVKPCIAGSPNPVSGNFAANTKIDVVFLSV